MSRCIGKVADGHGVILVDEAPPIRSLRFDSGARQSAIDLRFPWRPYLASARRLVSGLLIHPAPRRILLLGLGGGTLARFFLMNRHCTVDVVENRQAVVAVAHRYFGLPAGRRLRIFVRDAREHIFGEPFNRASYDLIIADVFGAHGIAPVAADPDFYHRLHQGLVPGGVLTANFWIRQLQADNSGGSVLKTAFGDSFRSVMTRTGNLVVIHSGVRGWPTKPLLVARAKKLEPAYDFDFDFLVRELSAAPAGIPPALA